MRIAPVVLPVPGVVLFLISPYVAFIWAVGYLLLALGLLTAAILVRGRAPIEGKKGASLDAGSRGSPYFRLAVAAGLTALALALAWLVYLAWIVATWPTGVP